jgi:regulatory protein
MAIALWAGWSFFLNMAGTITALTAQKRNPRRLNIEIDGEFAFGLDRLVAAWLTVGAHLSDEKIAALISKDSEEVLYQAALRLIDYRPRTRKELAERLRQKGYPSEQIDQTIERLDQNGLLNDRQYAEEFVEDRSRSKPRSRRLLKMELQQRGIASDLAVSAVQNLDDEASASAAGNKAIRRWQGLDRKTFERKCTDYLARRGFSFSTIRAVLPDLWRATQDQN